MSRDVTQAHALAAMARANRTGSDLPAELARELLAALAVARITGAPFDANAAPVSLALAEAARAALDAQPFAPRVSLSHAGRRLLAFRVADPAAPDAPGAELAGFEVRLESSGAILLRGNAAGPVFAAGLVRPAR